jgi:hypothetical protein
MLFLDPYVFFIRRYLWDLSEQKEKKLIKKKKLDMSVRERRQHSLPSTKKKKEEIHHYLSSLAHPNQTRQVLPILEKKIKKTSSGKDVHSARRFWNHFLRNELFKNKETCNCELFINLQQQKEFSIRSLTKNLVFSETTKGKLAFEKVQGFYQHILDIIQRQPGKVRQKFSRCLNRLTPWLNKIINSTFEKILEEFDQEIRRKIRSSEEEDVNTPMVKSETVYPETIQQTKKEEEEQEEFKVIVPLDFFIGFQLYGYPKYQFFVEVDRQYIDSLSTSIQDRVINGRLILKIIDEIPSLVKEETSLKEVNVKEEAI